MYKPVLYSTDDLHVLSLNTLPLKWERENKKKKIYKEWDTQKFSSILLLVSEANFFDNSSEFLRGIICLPFVYIGNTKGKKDLVAVDTAEHGDETGDVGEWKWRNRWGAAGIFI